MLPQKYMDDNDPQCHEKIKGFQLVLCYRKIGEKSVQKMKQHVKIFLWKKWYFVILLCCFPLVGKIEKKFGHFFHIIAVQKVISRNVFSTSRGRRPRDVEKMFREITFWTKIIWKNGQIVLKFLLNKWKTIQVMQQSIFFILE